MRTLDRSAQVPPQTVHYIPKHKVQPAQPSARTLSMDIRPGSEHVWQNQGPASNDFPPVPQVQRVTDKRAPAPIGPLPPKVTPEELMDDPRPVKRLGRDKVTRPRSCYRRWGIYSREKVNITVESVKFARVNFREFTIFTIFTS